MKNKYNYNFDTLEDFEIEQVNGGTANTDMGSVQTYTDDLMQILPHRTIKLPGRPKKPNRE